MQPLGLSHTASASRKQPLQFNVYRVRFLLGFLKFGLRKIEISPFYEQSFSLNLQSRAAARCALNFGERDPALPECFGCPYRASIVPEDLQKQICGVFGHDTIWGDMPGEFINHRLDRVVAVFVHSCVAPLLPLQQAQENV